MIDKHKTLSTILAQLERAGIQASIAPLYGAREPSIVIVVPGFTLEDDKLKEDSYDKNPV